VERTFAAAAAAKTFAVSLTVIDEQGLSDSCVRNVTVVNQTSP